MSETRSTCPYCGVGCGVVIEHDDTQITGVRGDPDHPANFGRLCTKGTNLHLTAAPVVIQHQRLREPQRRAERGAQPQVISWDAANREIADKLLAIRAEHGPESIGVYISGQLLTEDYHAFNKLARAVIGTPHIDSNSRLCMSSAVVGYKQSLGADAPPCSYEDIELADCVLISGANPAWAHPILFRRLEAAKHGKPGHRLIVIDPRKTETAELADLHLQIRAGTDVALCHGLLHAVIWQGWTAGGFIAASTDGFDALKELVRDWAPSRAAQVCGVKEADIWQAAEWFATSPSSLSLYCQGLNQSSSGTAKNTALINLHLATGQIGKPGAGPFSLTGQPNAMGGRESGGMATLLPGHRDPNKAEDWAEIEALWGVQGLPGQRGHTAVEMFEAAARGEIKALWIACTNPAQSMPDQATVRQALQRCELVILQEAFAHTATASYADYLLPAATWGEKEGTVTNSERRISRVRAAVP
ncbi:MAG: molybdopterin-dependent oxidoreductase, partial [Roseateles sp.]